MSARTWRYTLKVVAFKIYVQAAPGGDAEFGPNSFAVRMYGAFGDVQPIGKI